MSKRSNLLIAAFSAVYSFGALAAPFCVDVTGLPQQCYFVDPNSCRAEATRQRGQCVAMGRRVKGQQVGGIRGHGGSRFKAVQLSVVSCQLSVVGCRLSVVSCQYVLYSLTTDN